jgi:hypothetical protein
VRAGRNLGAWRRTLGDDRAPGLVGLDGKAVGDEVASVYGRPGLHVVFSDDVGNGDRLGGLGHRLHGRHDFGAPGDDDGDCPARSEGRAGVRFLVDDDAARLVARRPAGVGVVAGPLQDCDGPRLPEPDDGRHLRTCALLVVPRGEDRDEHDEDRNRAEEREP